MSQIQQSRIQTILATLALASLMMITGCATEENKDAMAGTGIGAAAGAAVGAILGHQTGHRGEGAAIGAMIGGGIGGVVGHRMDKQRQELAKIAETKRTEQGLITKLKSDILFATGRTDLKSEAKSNLSQMAAIMKKYPENVLTVRGYTDNTGSAKLNKDLSARRAQAVKFELANGGIPDNTISVVGMGPENPVAANDTEANRSKNRRVEVEITVDESKVPKK